VEDANCTLLDRLHRYSVSDFSPTRAATFLALDSPVCILTSTYSQSVRHHRPDELSPLEPRVLWVAIDATGSPTDGPPLEAVKISTNVASVIRTAAERLVPGAARVSRPSLLASKENTRRR